MFNLGIFKKEYEKFIKLYIYIYIYIYISIQFLVYDTKGVGLNLSELFFRGGNLRSFLKNIRLHT